MPQSVDNGVVTGGQQGRRPPTLSPPSSHNLHLSLTRSSHFTHNDSWRLIFDALCLHPLRHTTCCLKERINFLNLFNFFLPCHFPGSSFQYTANSKLFPRRWLRSSKVSTLPSDYTDGPHSVQAELPQEPTCTQKYLKVRDCGHTATCLGALLPKLLIFSPTAARF